MRAKNVVLGVTTATVLALVPAGSAVAATGERVLVYKITKASGFIRADFRGDQASGCADRGVCDYTGAVAYTFGGKPRSAESFILLDKRSGFVGGGNFRTNGVTFASVDVPGPNDCSDSVPHSADNFQFTRRGRTITVSFHNAQADTGPDYLNTRCPGPGEVDLTLARALPTGTFPLGSFKAGRVNILLSGERTFRGGGFTGNASWNVQFGLQQSRTSRGVTTF